MSLHFDSREIVEEFFFFLSFYLSHCFLGIHDEVLELQIVQAKRENQKKEHEASVTGVREREREREIDGIFFCVLDTFRWY